MIPLIIILSILFLLALLRVGVIIIYNTDGLALWLKVGFLKIHIDIESESKKKPQKTNTFKNLKPGSLREFTDILKIVKELLNRFRRKLLIKNLVLHITFAGDDPSKVAMGYGYANAAFGAIVPLLEKAFRIKRRDLRAAADFEGTETRIYAKLAISIAVWEIIYVGLAALPILKTGLVPLGIGDKNRKGAQNDGERTDKQPA